MSPRPSPSFETSRAARQRRKRRMVRYVLVFVGCVLLLDAVVGERGLLAMIEARREHRALERSLEALQAENAQLREQARRLREDPAAIEEAAREDLGLIRPGERLFLLRDAPPAEPPAD